MAHRITIDKPSEKSATNPESLKEKVEKHPFYYIAVTAIAVATSVAGGVFWLSEKYRVEPKNERIAYLDKQVQDRDDKISKLNAAYDPDRKQINELLATIQKLENNISVAQDSLKQLRDDNAKLQKRIKIYEANGKIFSQIDALDKRKSVIDRNIRNYWGYNTNDPNDRFVNDLKAQDEKKIRESNELQARILSLQQKLECEPK